MPRYVLSLGWLAADPSHDGEIPVRPVRSVFPWTGIVVALVMGLLFGALAAVIPARQAAKMDVIAALRYE